MRVTFLTQYYAPERGAPQTRLREMARELRRMGAEVTVVTSAPHYPDGRVPKGYSPWRIQRETIDDVEVVRFPSIPRPNRGFLDRLVDQASFAASAVASAGTIRRSDVFLVESPPLFLGATARVLRRITGTPYVFHVADPWPDFPVAMGALRGRVPIALARFLESASYRGAALVTTVTPPLVERLQRNPAASGRVRLLPNAVDLDRFDPARDPTEARRELGWPEAVTFVYAGSVGLAQGLGTLLDAVPDLPADPPVTIRIVGDGAEAEELAAIARERGLGQVVFQRSLPAARIPTVLAAADAVLVLLKRGPLYAESLPTKLLEACAAGRPVVISADGYPARLIDDSGAGFMAAAEDSAALANAMAHAISADWRETAGAAARRLATDHFGRGAAAARLLDYLLEAGVAAKNRA